VRKLHLSQSIVKEVFKSTTDLNSNEHLRLDSMIETLMPQLFQAVRWACLRSPHQTSRDEMEDICQEIILLLVEEDYRRLRSFNEQRSSLQTWLTAIAKHQLSKRFRRRKPVESLEDLPPNSLPYQPTQEEEIQKDEWRKKVRAAYTSLNEQERYLFRLCYEDELEPADIAAALKTKANLLYKRKHLLIKKIMNLVWQPSVTIRNLP